MWNAMGLPAKIVVGILFFMSTLSVGMMIDRAIAYARGRKPLTHVPARKRPLPLWRHVVFYVVLVLAVLFLVLMLRSALEGAR